MRSGALRHTIIIQEPTDVNTGGDPTILTWEEFDTVRAEVMPQRGSEYWSAKQIVDEEPVMFRIRYLADVTAKMRVLFDDKQHDIHHIENVEDANRELILTTTVRIDKYPQFAYFDKAVTEGTTPLTADFTWKTTAQASTKARYREVGQGWTASSETDTDPRVLEHAYTTPVLGIGNNYEIQPYGENEIGWTPGYGTSTTFYWDCDGTFHTGTFTCPTITISEEAAASGGAAYYVTITYTTDMKGSTRVRYREEGGEWTTLDEKDTDPRVTSHTETFGPLDGAKNYEGEVWTENCCGNTDGWQGDLTWGIDTDGTFLPDGYGEEDIVFSDFELSKQPIFQTVIVAWNTDVATKDKTRWRIKDSGDSWNETSLSVSYNFGHSDNTTMPATPNTYYELQAYGITEGGYEEWDILRYIRITAEGNPVFYGE